MFKKLTYAALMFLSFNSFAQHFEAELNSGINYATSGPSGIGLPHVGIGANYFFNDLVGAKIDYGFDKFSFDNLARNEKTGITSNRFSLQGIMSLNSLFSDRAYRKVTFYVHGGAGISMVKSSIYSDAKSDRIGNIIGGVTPRLELNENLAITLDLAGYVNLKQHYNNNGEFFNYWVEDSFNGLIFNTSFGLVYKFKN